MKQFTALTVLVASLASLSQGTASAQAASDFIAYPDSLTDLNTYRRSNKMRELTFNRMPGLSPDYELGPGDELEVAIMSASEQTLDLKVSASGEITIPLAGAIKVGGLTAEQAESAIADRFKEKQLIETPEVLVYVSGYQAKTVYALGEVDRPGEYSVSFQMTLMDFIFMAGGIDFTAARYGYLHRRPSGAAPDWRPTYVYADANDLARQPDRPRAGGEVVEIDLKPMKEGGVLKQNYVLRHGDVFYVPRRKLELVYVIGDVVAPGSFQMPEENRLTAARAISWAGGPTKTAKMSKGVLVRIDRNGRREERPVDFAAVLRGERPDVEVQPNDIIFVPGSSAKTAAYGVLNVIPNILTAWLIF